MMSMDFPPLVHFSCEIKRRFAARATRLLRSDCERKLQLPEGSAAERPVAAPLSVSTSTQVPGARSTGGNHSRFERHQLARSWSPIASQGHGYSSSSKKLQWRGVCDEQRAVYGLRRFR